MCRKVRHVCIFQEKKRNLKKGCAGKPFLPYWIKTFTCPAYLCRLQYFPCRIFGMRRYFHWSSKSWRLWAVHPVCIFWRHIKTFIDMLEQDPRFCEIEPFRQRNGHWSARNLLQVSVETPRKKTRLKPRACELWLLNTLFPLQFTSHCTRPIHVINLCTAGVIFAE